MKMNIFIAVIIILATALLIIFVAGQLGLFDGETTVIFTGNVTTPTTPMSTASVNISNFGPAPVNITVEAPTPPTSSNNSNVTFGDSTVKIETEIKIGPRIIFDPTSLAELGVGPVETPPESEELGDSKYRFTWAIKNYSGREVKNIKIYCTVNDQEVGVVDDVESLAYEEVYPFEWEVELPPLDKQSIIVISVRKA